MTSRSGAVSPMSCGEQSATSSRYSWNPYGGGGGGAQMHQWLHQCNVRLPAAVSPPTSEANAHPHVQHLNGSFNIDRSAMPSIADSQQRPCHPGPLVASHAQYSLQLHGSGNLRDSTRGELSDGFSQTMSEFDNLSTPRRGEKEDSGIVVLARKISGSDPRGSRRSKARDISASSPLSTASDGNCNDTDSRREDTEKRTDGTVGEGQQDVDAVTAIGRLRKIKRDENVPNQYKRYNRAMQARIASVIARDELLLLELCEAERGNIVVTIVESSNISDGSGPQPSPCWSPNHGTSTNSCTSSSPQSPNGIHGKGRGANDPADEVSSVLRRDAAYILSVVLQNCWRLCTNQGGCIALTRLFDVMPTKQRTMLEDFVVDHFLALAVHPFGNFIVQMVIQRQHDDEGVLSSILIHVSIPSSVIAIASSKFGSHVLETFFRHASPMLCCAAMQRLLSDEPTVRFLVSDNFGNYVIQQGMRRLAQQGQSSNSNAHLSPVGGAPHQQLQPVSTAGSASGRETTHPSPSQLRTPKMELGVELLLPRDLDIAMMRESFIAMLTPYLRDSPFCHNITKSFGLRKTPTSRPTSR